MFLYQTSASTKNIKKKWKDRKKSYKNNKFKIIYAPTQNETFELPDGLYSVSNIQNCFKHIIKKHETVTHNPPIRISVNKIKDRITFKIRTGYYLKRLTPETIKLLGNANNKITEKKQVEICLIQKSLKQYQFIVMLSTMIINMIQETYIHFWYKYFGQLLDISPKNFIILKTFYQEFSYIEVWFTDHNSKQLEIENKINIT